MDCDWLDASGHKMCAPAGIGQHGKLDLLRSMPPFWVVARDDCGCVSRPCRMPRFAQQDEAGTPAILEA